MSNVAPQKPSPEAIAKPSVKQKAHGQDKPKSPLPEKVSSGLAAVLNRNAFYRDGYRILQLAVLVEAGIIALLVFAIILIIGAHQPRDRYFATTADGSLIPMVPLSEPYMDRGKIVSWASTAATKIMTFGFHDYRQRLSDAGDRYFTEDGWVSFTKALERSRIIEALEGSQQVVTAAPRAAAVVVEEGLVNGVYTWVVQLPMTITYAAGSKTQSSSVLLTLRIVRVPTLKNPEGIGIQQWIADSNAQ